MNANKMHYTVEAVSPGTWAINDLTNREHVRGYALDLAYRFAKREGAVINVRAGRKFTQGRILSKYAVVDGKWTHVSGAIIRDLEGADGAACYMLKYPLPHVTRAYAEDMAA